MWKANLKMVRWYDGIFLFLFLLTFSFWVGEWINYSSNIHQNSWEILFVSVCIALSLTCVFLFSLRTKTSFSLYTKLLLGGFTLIFGGLTFYNITSCHGNTDWVCVADKAIASHNPPLCATTPSTDYCYLRYTRTQGDASVCDQVSERGKEQCLSNVATHTHDTNLCLTLSRNVRNECLTKIAVTTNDKQICELIKEGADKGNCEDYLGNDARRQKYLDSRYYF